MNFNTFGRLFSFTSFGESHGPVIGCVVDGCPARIPLVESDIQPFLDRRRPGRNQYISPRKEEDQIKILSGVYEGMTTGHPVMLMVENRDHRSSDYNQIKNVYQPGHADATYQTKYGFRDPRGGGRSSARETIARVAAGAVAKKVLIEFTETKQIEVVAGLIRLGKVIAEPNRWQDAVIPTNPFCCPDAAMISAMQEEIEKSIAAGNSLGGIVEIRIRNVPPGLGEPVYDRLDARIGAACLGLNAVKGVEIGDGFTASSATGLLNNDSMRRPVSGVLADAFQSNHAGGILGGISTGQEIIIRCAVKPTPSIAASQETVDMQLNNVDLEISGRHDPAVCIRSIPVFEAVLWCILADFFLLQRARNH